MVSLLSVWLPLPRDLPFTMLTITSELPKLDIESYISNYEGIHTLILLSSASAR